ncbi:DUF5050 domain-containing protein [Lysinibacillus sp. BW-2-10]|uniref:DUF5050 domain-containing protein n=1 Tax=Lysinibacillus sp. BW-2-10 TaxID=2590030 RepID=UPI00164261CF|nr:DUF5050 domain-containing protein [Lysinibacillus sp. BW-2-10]
MKNVLKVFLSLILVISIGLPISIGSTQAAELQWTEMPNQVTTDVNKTWTMTLSKEVNPQSVSATSVLLKGSNGQPLERITQVINGNQIVIKPKHAYTAGNSYTIYLNGIKSTTGKKLKNTKFSFNVQSTVKPAQEDTLYNAIYNALVNVQPEIDVSRFTKDSDKVFDTLTKILEDHPEIYYFQYEGSLFWSNGRFELKYHFAKSQIQAMNNQIEKIANKIISENITSDMSDFEKVRAIHDYVVLHTAYDYENYLNDSIPESSYDIDGLLLNGIAVCDGYAKTMKYLLEKIDIPVLYVPGKAREEWHAWNKVQIDGKWYSLDATWNDPAPNKEGYVSYSYFLIPDNVLDDDHLWDDTNFPDATDSKYLFMSDMWAFDLYEGDYYYSNDADDNKIYKINLDGTGKQKISDKRANELVVYDGWIYFSNYSHGGYLFKVKTDGSQLTQLNDFHITDLQRNGTTVTYTNEQGMLYNYEIK